MYIDLYPYFEAIESQGLGMILRDSIWMFPVIECVHLLALAMLGGAVMIVDFRLLGFGLSGKPLREVAESMQPWLKRSLITILVTGVLLFMSEAVKCYYSPPFWYKMGFLATAIIFTFSIKKRVLATDEAALGPIKGRVIALLSLGLWFGVGFSGRWIAFY